MTAPDSQLLKLLSVRRLISILDEADDCSVIRKLQELDRGVFRCAVICVEGEEQWGENTSLRGTSADGESPGCEFALEVCPGCEFVRKLSAPLTDGGGHRELCEFV